MVMRARQKIRAPRKGIPVSGDEFEKNWKDLSTSLKKIHTKDASELSFEQLYRNAYSIVKIQRAEDLYERTKELEKEWLCGEVQKRVVAAITPRLLLAKEAVDMQDQFTEATERRETGERFLSALSEVWEDHQICMKMITDVLMYMDRVVALRKVSIYAAAMALFRDHVLRSPVSSSNNAVVADVLKSTVLFMIQLERSGHMIDRALIHSCIKMLEGLYETEAEEESSKLYLTSFEPDYLEASAAFYRAEGKRLLETVDAATFCAVVSARIAEEKERCQYTISLLSESKIKEIVDNELIRNNLAEVVNFEGTGVRVMLDHDRIDNLSKIYALSARVDPKKTHLTAAVQKRIVEMGNEINNASFALAQAPAQPKSTGTDAGQKKEKEKEKPVNQVTSSAIKWVDDILALKKKFDGIWKDAFGSDQVLQSAITASFSSFLNSTPRSSEFLSLFFDENLKKGVKGKTDNEVDALLENGITLLRYIKDKDRFEAYYKKHLSRRLLMKRSMSMDAERQMISKMKMEVGNQFTQRLEAMFRDMTISEDLTASYKQFVREQGDPDKKRFELDINVLTSTMWPMEIMSSSRDGQVELPCIIPKEVETVKQSFEKFYLDKHSGRKLSWQPSMGTADIKATFHRSNGKVQRHELNVSTYAMFILLLFNDIPIGESLTFEEIQARTRIPDNDLIRNLQSLAVAPKTRVLKKVPMSRDVKPTDKFYFNNDFQSPFMKVRIGVVSGGANKVESQDQRKETEEKMNNERGGSIEAAIVRIMKQRKTLIHSNLISEVLSQLSARFVPDVNMVKRRIESLIDREYLERVSEDPPTYGYVA
ncbi:cullin culC [Aspergillus nidulans FGSC A4]|uniref:SCF ubiquitin ligase subunit CulC, putative (AFU_orthologue AFUA_6G08220) n=1 Tax=Emericella nidulans (strain FGSC A4 / ATCC 38163 / CBS 112.46 / NRRL 194 / M139) TaxID=227321 RepID=C8V637_EMENI|nr:cullin culC [Aspergillus nidulans FGSC A4]CBF75050.1 TPA: SCF ubiquitin ligase subunit CulC, putative (AFU_orthologue; AFUA_6G08220) [Aspergillus nidulans FGSC A4]